MPETAKRLPKPQVREFSFVLWNSVLFKGRFGLWKGSTDVQRCPWRIQNTLHRHKASRDSSQPLSNTKHASAKIANVGGRSDAHSRVRTATLGEQVTVLDGESARLEEAYPPTRYFCISFSVPRYVSKYDKRTKLEFKRWSTGPCHHRTFSIRPKPDAVSPTLETQQNSQKVVGRWREADPQFVRFFVGVRSVAVVLERRKIPRRVVAYPF